jgi:PsbP
MMMVGAVRESIPPDGSVGGATARRSFVVRAAEAAAAMMMVVVWTGCGNVVATARAVDDDNSKSSSSSSSAVVVYRNIEQGFEFAPPPGFQQTAKPLPTHLKEVQFAPAAVSEDDNASTAAAAPLPKSYQYGITVDPVRIDSLRDFGTPQEVAARVVAAELRRDGVFVVTLMKDPIEQMDEGGKHVAYVLNYKSQGKRGDRRFVCKFYIAQNRLYALTAQCRENEYSTFEKDMDAALTSFRLLPA